MGVFLAVLVVTGVAAALLYPYLFPALEPLHESGGPSARMAQLEERKIALYGAIRDLGFDYRTDKVTREDYEDEVEALKSEAVGVVTELEDLQSKPPRGTDALEAEIRRSLEGAGALADSGGATAFCTQCGQPVGSGDRFCARCGAPQAR